MLLEHENEALNILRTLANVKINHVEDSWQAIVLELTNQTRMLLAKLEERHSTKVETSDAEGSELKLEAPSESSSEDARHCKSYNVVDVNIVGGDAVSTHVHSDVAVESTCKEDSFPVSSAAEEMGLIMDAIVDEVVGEPYVPPLLYPEGSSCSDDSKSVASSVSAAVTGKATGGAEVHRVDHFAFLFSSPCVFKHPATNTIRPLDSLDFQSEIDIIKEAIVSSNKMIRGKVEAATIEGFRRVLHSGVSVLHFSGHGATINGLDYLLFEDGTGGLHSVDADELREMLVLAKHQLKLVYLSSCHSERVGQLFYNAGVQYVVCITRDAKVLDSAAIAFAEAFYAALCSGKTPPCSFDIAKKSISLAAKMRGGEAEKFILLQRVPGGIEDLLLHEEMPEEKPIFHDIPSGTCRFEASPKFGRWLPVEEDSFTGRKLEMHQVLVALSENRLVSITGAPGIGKTTLAKHVTRFAFRRRIIGTDGALFVSLRGCTSASAAITAITRGVVENCHGGKELLASAAGAGGAGKESEETALLDMLENHSILIVLDNFEDVLNSDGSNVRLLLSTLLSSIPKLRILVTSRQSIGGGLHGAGERVLPLHRLTPEEAALLLVRRAPRKLKGIELGVEASKRTEFLAALVKHPVLRFLDGHPQSICLAAPLLENKTLDELSESLHGCGITSLQIPGIPTSERTAVDTLMASLRVSVDALSNRSPDAVILLGLFGLLNGGALNIDLDVICHGCGLDVTAAAAELLRSSLVERRALSIATAGVAEYKQHLTRHFQKCSGISPTSELREPSATQTVVLIYRTFPFVASYAERLLRRTLFGDVKSDILELEAGSTAFNLASLFPLIANSGKLKFLATRCITLFAGAGAFIFDHIASSNILSVTAYTLLDIHMPSMWAVLQRAAAAGCSYGETASSISGAIVDLRGGVTGGSATPRDASPAEAPKSAPWHDQLLLSMNSISPMWNSARTAGGSAAGASFIGMSEPVSSMPMFASFGSVRDQVGTPMDIAIIASTFAPVLLLQGWRQEASCAAYAGVLFCQNGDDRLAEAHVSKAFATLELERKQVETAKTFFGSSNVLYRQSANKLGEAATQAGLGTLHVRIQNLYGAETCFQRALKSYSSLQHLNGMLYCTKWLGLLHKKLPSFAGTSEKYYAAARRLQGQINELARQQARGSAKSAKLSSLSGRISKAKQRGTPRDSRNTIGVAEAWVPSFWLLFEMDLSSAEFGVVESTCVLHDTTFPASAAGEAISMTSERKSPPLLRKKISRPSTSHGTISRVSFVEEVPHKPKKSAAKLTDEKAIRPAAALDTLKTSSRHNSPMTRKSKHSSSAPVLEGTPPRMKSQIHVSKRLRKLRSPPVYLTSPHHESCEGSDEMKKRTLSVKSAFVAAGYTDEEHGSGDASSETDEGAGAADVEISPSRIAEVEKVSTMHDSGVLGGAAVDAVIVQSRKVSSFIRSREYAASLRMRQKKASKEGRLASQ